MLLSINKSTLLCVCLHHLWTLCERLCGLYYGTRQEILLRCRPPIPGRFTVQGGFSNNQSMVIYVRKKGKAIVSLSTMQHSKVVDEDPANKKNLSSTTPKEMDTPWNRPSSCWNAYTHFTTEHPEFKSCDTNACMVVLQLKEACHAAYEKAGGGLPPKCKCNSPLRQWEGVEWQNP